MEFGSDDLETTVSVPSQTGHSKQFLAHKFFSALTDAVGTSNRQFGQ